MSEQRVMTTPIFDELVSELGSAPEENTAPQGDEQQDDER
jgi:hypothetical protein